eukprot:356056-Chlamydomonas_euryale.AAC.4
MACEAQRWRGQASGAPVWAWGKGAEACRRRPLREACRPLTPKLAVSPLLQGHLKRTDGEEAALVVASAWCQPPPAGGGEGWFRPPKRFIFNTPTPADHGVFGAGVEH